MSVELILGQEARDLTSLSNSLSALISLNNTHNPLDSAKGIKNIIVQHYNKGNSKLLMWISGHSFKKGNENADTHFKQPSESTSSISISFIIL